MPAVTTLERSLAEISAAQVRAEAWCEQYAVPRADLLHFYRVGPETWSVGWWHTRYDDCREFRQDTFVWDRYRFTLK